MNAWLRFKVPFFQNLNFLVSDHLRRLSLDVCAHPPKMPPAPAAALFCIMLLSSALSHGASACSSALDCALSGDCVSGTCACDAAWSGPSCTTLNLVPMAPTQASSGAYRHGTQTSCEC